jgi:glycosyltransferase involved in cell wall biosynthesis
MKRVLVLAYLYPPIFNSGTRRSLEFVNHLPDHGWHPTVLTLADPSPTECDPSLLDEVRAGTRIERAPLAGNRWARRLAYCAPPALRPRVHSGLAWRLHRLWQVPDAAAGWIGPALARALQLHAEQAFDAIYASGWPWSSFVLAERISQRTGLPFLVDYRDLWQPGDVAWDQATPAQRRHNPALERQVLARAAGVIATTQSFLDLLPQELLPARRYAITNGFTHADFAGARPVLANDGKLRIVYTGVWRPGYGPDDLYGALQLLQQRGDPALARLQVVMAGFTPGRAAELKLDGCVQELGRVPHAQAIDLMCGADALYLPVSNGVYEYASIPGKLFEYLGSGRPILASAQNDSEVARVLDEVGGACRLLPGDVPSLAEALSRLGQPQAVFATRQPQALARYTRAALTGKLAAALNDITAGS